MNRSLRSLVLAIFATSPAPSLASEGEMVVTGALRVAGSSPRPTVAREQAVGTTRCRRRDRNPYYAARPVYPPASNGARANVTFEPYTRWYYPNENSYYPPLNTYPSIRSR